MRHLTVFAASVTLMLAAGCETNHSPRHVTSGQNLPPRTIWVTGGKVVRQATPAYGRGYEQARPRQEKLIYDDNVGCYVFEDRDRYYYDHVNERYLRIKDNGWQMSPDFDASAHWEKAPDDFVPPGLRKKYEGGPNEAPGHEKHKENHKSR